MDILLHCHQAGRGDLTQQQGKRIILIAALELQPGIIHVQISLGRDLTWYLTSSKKKTVNVSGDFLCFAVFIYEEREHTMLDRFYNNRSLSIFTVMVGGYLKSTEDDIYKDSKS